MLEILNLYFIKVLVILFKIDRDGFSDMGKWMNAIKLAMVTTFVRMVLPISTIAGLLLLCSKSILGLVLAVTVAWLESFPVFRSVPCE